MVGTIDLSDVLLTEAAVLAWQEFSKQIAPQLAVFGVTNMQQIPDERIRINADGSLTVFVALPNGEVSMNIPHGEWAYRKQH